MKKLLVYLIALMLFSCVALAEPVNAITLGILNPRISVDGNVLLDLSRLDVETSLMFDEKNAIGILLDVNVGENYETNVFSGQARWDDDKLDFSINEIDRLYTVSVPKVLSASGVGFRRLFHPSDSPIPNIQLSDLTAEQRMALLEAVLEPYVKDRVIINNDRILSFDISQEDSTIAVSGLIGFLDGILPDFSQNSILSLFGNEDGLGLNLKGKLSISPDGLKLESDGALITLRDGAIIPLVQNLTDSYDGFTLTIGLGENQQGKLVVTGKMNPLNGNIAVSYDEYQNGQNTITGSFNKTANDGKYEYVLDYTSAHGQAVHAEFSDGLAGSNPCFALDARYTLDPAEGEKQITASYNGQYIGAADNLAQGGLIKLGFDIEGKRYDFESTVVLMMSADLARYVEWANQLADSLYCVDLTNGSKEDVYQFEADISVIAAGALTKLQQNVPGVNELLVALQNIA